MTDTKLREAARTVLSYHRHGAKNDFPCWCLEVLEAALAEPEEPKVERVEIVPMNDHKWNLVSEEDGILQYWVHPKAGQGGWVKAPVGSRIFIERPIPVKSNPRPSGPMTVEERIEWLEYEVTELRRKK